MPPCARALAPHAAWRSLARFVRHRSAAPACRMARRAAQQRHALCVSLGAGLGGADKESVEGGRAVDVGALLDRTTRMVCSVTLVKGARRAFPWSRWEASRRASSGCGSRGTRTGRERRQPRARTGNGVRRDWQLGIPNASILLASNGDVAALLARWSAPPLLAVPPDVARDMQGTDLVLYIPELPGGLAESAAQNGVHIPVQEIWLDAVKASGGYNVFGTANTSSEKEAKLLTLVLRLGIVAWMRTNEISDIAARLKTVTVTASGTQVKLQGLSFTEEEIIPMFLSLVKGLSPAAPAAGAEGTPQ